MQGSKQMIFLVKSYPKACALAAATICVYLGEDVFTRATAQELPTDPKPTCTVDSTLFHSWFKSGSVTLDGVVNPANGIKFNSNVPKANCQFYRWSEQMFLWLTSPAPPEYGGGRSRIYASPVFFNVSPADQSGNRRFLPNDPLGPFGPFGKEPLSVRTLQKGPGGRQILFTKTGRLVEIEPAPRGARPMVRDTANAKIEVVHAVRAESGALVLKTAKDVTIQPQPRSRASDGYLYAYPAAAR